MSKRIAVESFYDELLTLQGYEEHEKVAFLGRIAGGFDRLRGATKSISSAMKQQAGALKKGPGMKVTQDVVGNLEDGFSPGQTQDIFETAKRQVGGLELSRPELAEIRGLGGQFDNMSEGLSKKLKPFIPEGTNKNFKDIPIQSLDETGNLKTVTLGELQGIDQAKIQKQMFDAQLNAISKEIPTFQNQADEFANLKTNVKTLEDKLTSTKNEIVAMEEAVKPEMQQIIGLEIDDYNRTVLRPKGITEISEGIKQDKMKELTEEFLKDPDNFPDDQLRVKLQNKLNDKLPDYANLKTQAENINTQLTSAQNSLEGQRKNLETLVSTLDSANKMQKTKADIMKAAKGGFLFDSDAAMKNRVDKVLKESGLNNVIKVDDYTPEGLNNVMARLDSLETSTREAANQAVKDLGDFKMTGRIGGEIEEYIRMNPNIAMENLSPEQINTLAQIRGLEAISDLVEPVTMGAATAGVGLAGLGGAYLGASAIDKLLG